MQHPVNSQVKCNLHNAVCVHVLTLKAPLHSMGFEQGIYLDLIMADVLYSNIFCSLTSSNVVATCTDLGHSVNNGNVHYSGDLTEQGRYVENTTVTVSCDEGYRGGGHITCQNDGNWSSLSLRLPRCTGKLALSLSINYV